MNASKNPPPKSPNGSYNYHTWSRFMVREPSEAPKGAHYAAVLFGTHEYCTPGWGKDDPSVYQKRPEVTYFQFPDHEHLEAWVGEASRADLRFFFFRVTRLGSVQMRVDMDLGEEDDGTNPQHALGHGRGD